MEIRECCILDELILYDEINIIIYLGVKRKIDEFAIFFKRTHDIIA